MTDSNQAPTHIPRHRTESEKQETRNALLVLLELAERQSDEAWERDLHTIGRMLGVFEVV